MYKRFSITLCMSTFIISFLLLTFTDSLRHRRKKTKTELYKFRTKTDPGKICVRLDQTLRARHKSCFLRPDTGPCRADILQWYYDVRQARCYRFFWGGCQGNGNRFESRDACRHHCALNTSYVPTRIPYYCSLSFDYGTCFGYFNRWAWDKITKTCRRKLYSGCGGNQNNFQSQAECWATCLNPPNNTLQRAHHYTTCIPLNVAGLQ